MRLDDWSNTLTLVLDRRSRVHLECGRPEDFRSTLEIARVNSFALIRHAGTPQRAHCRAQDEKIGPARSFGILVNLSSPWRVVHRRDERLAAGDAILIDSEIDIDLRMGDDFEISHLKVPEQWLRQWLPSPGMLVGRRLTGGTGWGGALAAFVGGLSPALAEHAAMPLSMMIDHVGALLSFATAEAGSASRREERISSKMNMRVLDLVRQRCTERNLSVMDVAAALGVSARTVHRTLARSKSTFGELLIEMRTRVALDMLQSPLCRRLTIAEIGHRAGFSEPSHFSRTIRARCGRTPVQISLESGRALEEAR